MKRKRAALYVRVSTHHQTVENQTIELERYCERQGWRITKTYEDSAVSGTKTSRPALNEMLADAAKGRFDILVVYKIDRLARSTVHLLHVLTELTNSGVGFCSTTQALDTTTSYGKMVTTFLAAIAEFERDTIVERVKSGLERAKKNGVRLGRPRAGFDIGKALELKRQGLGMRRIAKRLGVSSGTVYNYLKSVQKTSA